MARRRKSVGTRSLLIPLVLVALVAAGAWYLLRDHSSSDAANGVAADRVDARNEGRTVSVSGELHAVNPVHDAQLGIRADAIALLRTVEMLQWQEHCASSCEYALGWSEHAIDSHAFREPQGHANTSAFPFASKTFVSDDIRLGAFAVDGELALAGATPVAHAVHVAQLPPNLAATFHDCDGALCTGTDAAHPLAGDLRVRYRIVESATRTLSGVQQGNRLHPSASR